MKKIILIIIAVVAANNMFAQYFPVDTAKLNNSYRELMKMPNNPQVQKKYFDAFPSSWKEYIITYGYLPNDNYDLTMYSFAHEQVEAFGELTSIPDSVYFKKLVIVSIGGRLDADAPNYLQMLLWNKMRSKINMKCIFEYLSQLRIGHRMEFWEFYWSSILPKKDIADEFERLKSLNKDEYPEEVQIMADAYKYFYNGINFESVGYLK